MVAERKEISAVVAQDQRYLDSIEDDDEKQVAFVTSVFGRLDLWKQSSHESRLFDVFLLRRSHDSSLGLSDV